MAYIYSDPTREDSPTALPDVEVFYVTAEEASQNDTAADVVGDDDAVLTAPGWYWWACLPGCLPDGEPDGPYATEQEAIDSAREFASW